MADQRLRELERVWRESGMDSDAEAYLAERYRMGQGTPELTELARASAAMWAGKPIADTKIGEAVAALLGELKGHPKCSVTTTGERGEVGAKGDPGDTFTLNAGGQSMQVSSLRVEPGPGVEVQAESYGYEAVLRINVEAGVLFARDRYGRPVQAGDQVTIKDQYGSEPIHTVSRIDAGYGKPQIVVDYWHGGQINEDMVTLQGYEVPEPPTPPLPPRYPSEADRTLRNAIEVNRWAEDAPDHIPASMVSMAIARGGVLDVTQLAMDGSGRVIRVGNMVKHQGEVWNVDQVNLPGDGVEPYPDMRRLVIRREGETKTVRELAVDYIDEREA
jgi:hypothetical protein